MVIISVIGSKGGVGASLVATNIATALAGSASTVLVDLHAGMGVDDLLLDVKVGKTWADLIPVLDELDSKHIDLATSGHASGLKLLCGPYSWTGVGNPTRVTKLLHSLKGCFDYSVIDLPVGLDRVNRAVLSICDVTLLVTTADPPALRCAMRFVADLEPDASDKVGLVINQINHQHPSTPVMIAESLDLTLLAALPPDPRAIGYQIHFGRVCVQDPSSMFGRAISALTNRLHQSARAKDKSVPFVDQDGGTR